MILDLVLPACKMPRYLVLVNIYIWGIGLVLSITMIVIISLKERKKSDALRNTNKLNRPLTALILVLNLYLYHVVNYDFCDEGWYGEVIGKEIKNGRYYITFELNSRMSTGLYCTYRSDHGFTKIKAADFPMFIFSLHQNTI